jgi:hypothetical protein
MPADPSAKCPGVSQSTFSVSSTQCGAQVGATASAGGEMRSCTLCMRIHPIVRPPPVSGLDLYTPMSTHD